ncbi:MAG: YfiR family protein [Vulcanimicrobiota bacterium]
MDVLKRILSLVLACALVSPAAFGSSHEYQIKAAFIYNFLRYIEWPTERSAYSVGILGEDPFEGGLDQFQKKPLGGKNITVKIVKTAKEARSCDVLFISATEADKLEGTLAALKGAPVLTISDLPSFTEHGGQIGFTTERNRVRFIVNTDALSACELKASSNLLKLAILKNS